MATQTWKWAALDPEQMALLKEAEDTLGADYLLAFEPSDASGRMGESERGGLPMAQLNQSQIECLQGLETRLNAVVIAYQDEPS
jgi:hypothetical protein